jgi:hypothetical protein
MSGEYSFPVPQSTAVPGWTSDTHYHMPLQERYAEHWKPGRGLPAFLDAFESWRRTAYAQVQVLHEMWPKLDPRGDHAEKYYELLSSYTDNLKLLLSEFNGLYVLAATTLPFDPVVRRWIDAARALESRSRGRVKKAGKRTEKPSRTPRVLADSP